MHPSSLARDLTIPVVMVSGVFLVENSVHLFVSMSVVIASIVGHTAVVLLSLKIWIYIASLDHRLKF